MAIKPILFNTQMVRAIIEGRKKTTRRIVKAKGYDITGIPSWAMFRRNPDNFFFDVCKTGNEPSANTATTILIEPPARPGDILYIRETWAEMPYGYVFRADCTDDEQPEGWDNNDRWRPSIHMPRKAARLFLRVKDLSAERLQEIDENGIEQEGTDLDAWFDYDEWQHQVGDGLVDEGFPVNFETMCDFFGHTVWDKTMQSVEQYKKYGWEANPFVWVVDFERIERPENWN